MDKLPCASFLVRCFKAPEEDGVVLGIKSGFARLDWPKLGIWPYPKSYKTGAFNSKECYVNESEIELFASLDRDINRKDENGAVFSIQLKAVEFSIKLGKVPDATKSVEEINQELYELIDQSLIPSSTVPIIDLKYFALYNENAGFKVAIDGFHNLKKKGIYVTAFGLNPPGVLYNGDEVELNEEERWQVLKIF